MISDYNSAKETLRNLLEESGEVIDLCEYFPDLLGGIGYNELRYFSIDENGEIEAESNNVHDTEKGEDCYMSFTQFRKNSGVASSSKNRAKRRIKRALELFGESAHE